MTPERFAQGMTVPEYLAQMRTNQERFARRLAEAEIDPADRAALQGRHLVVASVLLLSLIVDYSEQVDEFLKNHPPTEVILGYYRAFLLSISMDVAPFALLIATTVAPLGAQGLGDGDLLLF